MNISIARATRRNGLILWIYLALITLAELLTALGNPQLGLALHALLLIGLALHGALARSKTTRNMVLALTLAPLIRLLSLSLPLTRLPQISWYPVVAVPLLLATWVVIRQVGATRRELGLTRGQLPLQLALMSGGLALGVIEFLILRPSPLLATFSWSALVLAGITLLISTGFTEELIFRGLLQTTARPALGRWSLLYVALLFAVLHIGYLSAFDVLFVFIVGLIFGWIVRLGGSILGVTLAHGLTNIILFLILPSLSPSAAEATAPWMFWIGLYIWVAVVGLLLLQTWPRRAQIAPDAAIRLAIRGLRKQSGLTYTDLALRSGLNVRQLAEIEHGLIPLPNDLLQQIARGLGVAPTVFTQSA